MDEVLNILYEARPRQDVCILLLESSEDGTYTVHRTSNYGLYDPLAAPEPRKTIITTHDRGLAETAFAGEVAHWENKS